MAYGEVGSQASGGLRHVISLKGNWAEVSSLGFSSSCQLTEIPGDVSEVIAPVIVIAGVFHIDGIGSSIRLKTSSRSSTGFAAREPLRSHPKG